MFIEFVKFKSNRYIYTGSRKKSPEEKISRRIKPPADKIPPQKPVRRIKSPGDKIPPKILRG